jgi:hypothetical protein
MSDSDGVERCYREREWGCGGPDVPTVEGSRKGLAIRQSPGGKILGVIPWIDVVRYAKAKQMSLF